MNWNDVSKLWQQQPATAGVAPEWNRIAREMADECRHRSRQRFFRNLREGLVGVGLSVALISWSCGQAKTWTGMVAALLVLIPAGIYLAEVIRGRESRPPEDLSLAERLTHESAELRRERRLLRTIGLWCLLPLAAAWVLLWTKIIREVAAGLEGQTLAIAWLVLFQAGFAVALGMTHWRVGCIGARRIERELEKVEELRGTLAAARGDSIRPRMNTDEHG
jgi:hypothetical protein